LLAREAICEVHLDVFALDLLRALALTLPVLVKLRESVTHVVHEELRQLLVILDDVAEEFAKVVVNDAAKLLFERESLKIFPLKTANFECIDSVFEFIDFFRLFGHEFVIFALHASHDDDVV